MSKPTCFVIMPITTPETLLRDYQDNKSHFHHVLEHLFIPSIETAGYEPIRPIAEGSEVIHARIIKYLETADLVLCDISSHNPNVFFELGIRVALNKPVAYVKDRNTRIPFDTNPNNHHEYNGSVEGFLSPNEKKRLTDHLRNCDITKGNPMFEWFKLSTAAQSFQSDSDIGNVLKYLMGKIDELPSALRDITPARFDYPPGLYAPDAYVKAPYIAMDLGIVPPEIIPVRDTLLLFFSPGTLKSLRRDFVSRLRRECIGVRIQMANRSSDGKLSVICEDLEDASENSQ